MQRETERGTIRAGMISEWRGEAFCGLILIVAGVLFALGGRRMSLFEDSVPGPGLVPFIAGILLALLGAVIAAAALRRRSQSPVTVFDRDSLAAAVLMLAAVAAFEYAGYLLSTFAFLWACFVVIGRERPLKSGLVAAAATLLTWAMFVKALGVALPAGILALQY